MGFSFKVIPGLRMRVSSRGIRTSVGPRGARLHVGGGRTSVSTGFGPFTASTRLGGGRKRRSSGSTARYQQQLAEQKRRQRDIEQTEVRQQRLLAQAQRQAAAYQRGVEAQERRAAVEQRRRDKEQAAAELAAAFTRILDLHRAEFPPAQRPIAPQPLAPDRAGLYQRFYQQASAGVGRRDKTGLAAASARAQAWTEQEAARLSADWAGQQAAYQQQLDAWWANLCGNEPDTVVAALNHAFEDNEAPSAALGVDGTVVALAVMLPQPDDVLPDRMPARTDAGNLALRKLTAKQRSDLYGLFVCGQILVTVREALAVAPAITGVRVVCLRDEGKDAYGRPSVGCIAAVLLHRDALDGIAWSTADSGRIVHDAAAEQLFHRAGRSAILAPLDLTDEPDLAALVEAAAQSLTT